MDESFIDGLSVTCPRCGRRGETAEVFVFTGETARRLTDMVVRGEIQRPAGGREITSFELGCGCAFDLQAWNLHVTTSVTKNRGGLIDVRVTRRAGGGPPGQNERSESGEWTWPHHPLDE